MLRDINEQKQISEILDKVLDIISMRKQQLAELDELIKSRFIELFGDPMCNSKGWTVYKLGDVCVVNPKKAELGNVEDEFEVSFVPMPLVSEKGDIDTTDIRMYGDVKKGFTYFREDDVLFAKITPCMENGKGAVAIGLKNKVGFGSTEFHVLRPKLQYVNSQWVYTLTTFAPFRKEAEKKMTGSAGQKRVPASFLDSFKVGVPPIEIQNQFATFVQQLDKQKLVLQQSLAEMEELFNSLMQQVFH